MKRGRQEGEAAVVAQQRVETVSLHTVLGREGAVVRPQQPELPFPGPIMNALLIL